MSQGKFRLGAVSSGRWSSKGSNLQQLPRGHEGSWLTRFLQRRTTKKLAKAERAYLKSYGWVERSEGWARPAWHPKVHEGPGNYDQAHCVNSQKKYGGNAYRELLSSHKVGPVLSSYRALYKILYNWVLWSAVATTTWYFENKWTQAAIVFGSVFGILVGGAYWMRELKREIELDEAERRLSGRSVR